MTFFRPVGIDVGLNPTPNLVFNKLVIGNCKVHFILDDSLIIIKFLDAEIVDFEQGELFFSILVS